MSARAARQSRLSMVLCASALSAALGCGSHSATTVTESEAQTNRLACKFGAGDLATKTLATSDPTGDQIPIDHIVLVMQENRSFDAYYSHLAVPGQTVEAASDTATNPDATGKPVSRFHWSSTTAAMGNPNGKDWLCFADTDHGWDQTHNEYDSGALDGFVRTNNDSGNGDRAMGYYDERDLPFYYALSQAFAISDQHFCSVMGPTYPNRLFYLAGTSFGYAYNNFAPTSAPDGAAYQNIFLELAAKNVSWKVYSEDFPTSYLVNINVGNFPNNFAGVAQYFLDAQNGQLPAVSFVEGSDSGAGTIMVTGAPLIAVDEHPAQDIQLGQAFVAQIVASLMKSPEWPSSALFLTYDEEGGEYDHVPPADGCAPDDLPLELGGGDHIVAGFNQYGFRTPLIVVSPYAKRGYVSHEVVDHTAITRFVETRFDLPAMTHRDANAWPLLDMFDFASPDTTVPTLPAATIDQAQQAACEASYPAGTPGGF